MTVRVDNAPLIPGAVVIGATGRGILGSTILLAPVPGREPSVLASSVTPGTEGSEFRAKIVSYPVGGDLYMWEDGSYTYSGPPGTVTFDRYRDGLLYDTGSVSVGGGAALAGTADAMERADAGGGVAMLYALAGGHDALGTADSGGVLALFVIAPWIFTSELRAVRVTSDTYGLLGKFVKQPSEVLDYRFDFTEWLRDCQDTIADKQVDAFGDGALQVTQVDQLDGSVAALVAGGVNGKTYKLTCTITTAGGRKKEADIQIRIKES